MSDQIVSLDDLIQTRSYLVNALHKSLTPNDKDFLVSFKQGKPAWDLVDMTHIQHYPSIQWKLHNIQAMTANKHRLALKKLVFALELF